MVKGLVTHSIDTNIYERFCDRVGNKSRSAVVESLIENYISYDNKEVSKVDQVKTENEMQLIEERLKEDSARLRILKDTALKLDMAQKEEAARVLEAAQMEKERESKCFNCGSILGFKFHRFNKGNICQSCFLSSHKEDIDRWS